MPGRRWGDLGLRVASAAVLAPVGVAAMWLGGVAWDALVLLAVAGLGMEWAALVGARARGWPGLGVPALALAACGLTLAGQGGAALGLLAAGAAALWALPGGRLAAAGGVALVGLAGVALVWLRADAAVGRADLFLVMLPVWASDVGAYVAGRLIGGPKLAPRISPGKTRSGAVGGLVAGALAGVGVALVAGAAGGALGQAALVAGLLAAVSQAGDLLESAVKRHYGVKDSGWLIPGHGGLLDRLDGVLAAAPAAALLALALGRGVALWD